MIRISRYKDFRYGQFIEELISAGLDVDEGSVSEVDDKIELFRLDEEDRELAELVYEDHSPRPRLRPDVKDDPEPVQLRLLFRILNELGYTEEEIRSAVRAARSRDGN